MKILSIRQPWAWAIIHGGKDVENRNWKTNYRGPLIIHASKQFDVNKADWNDYSTGFYGEPWHSMARGYNQQPAHVLGAVIGVVELYDCIPSWRCDSKWKAGDDPDYFCWLLRNPVAIPYPIPLKGKLGLFNPPDQVRQVIEEALKS